MAGPGPEPRPGAERAGKPRRRAPAARGVRRAGRAVRAPGTPRGSGQAGPRRRPGHRRLREQGRLRERGSRREPGHHRGRPTPAYGRHLPGRAAPTRTRSAGRPGRPRRHRGDGVLRCRLAPARTASRERPRERRTGRLSGAVGGRRQGTPKPPRNAVPQAAEQRQVRRPPEPRLSWPRSGRVADARRPGRSSSSARGGATARSVVRHRGRPAAPVPRERPRAARRPESHRAPGLRRAAAGRPPERWPPPRQGSRAPAPPATA